MKRYAEYKDSGVAWIGEIPAEWKIMRLKYLADISTGDKDTVMAESNGIYPFFVRSKTVETINSFSLDGEAILTAGDGDIGKIVHYINGKFDYHQRVYCLSKIQSHAKFLYYYFSCFFIKEAEMSNAKSTVDSIRMPVLKKSPILLAENFVQARIAAYLDRKTASIDNLIADKQRLIALLKEKRQAIISEAVTKGLDPTVPMKDSGVELIGEIPAHWEVKRFNTLFSFGRGLAITKANLEDDGIPCVSYGEIHSRYSFEVNPVIHHLRCVNENYLNMSPGSLLKYGDFVFADTSEDIEGSGNFYIPQFARKSLCWLPHSYCQKQLQPKQPISCLSF